MEPVLFLTIHFREEIIMSAVTTTKKKSFTTFQMALIAVMAAITCILGPLSIPIPISPVPISLTNLAIYLTVCLLGWKFGTISYLIYLLIGIAGLPVFSGFSSGFAKLLGPTGGYLIGFIPMAIICGFAFEKFSNRGMQVFHIQLLHRLQIQSELSFSLPYILYYSSITSVFYLLYYTYSDS